MREFLNGILIFIGAASLTDAEFDLITLEDQEENAETYNALVSILNARESVSDTKDRLKFYFKAAGVYFVETEGSSQIYVGGVLCK